MVCYSNLFQDFPVCYDPHKGFHIVNKSRSRCFSGILFFWDPVDVGNLVSGPSAFSKSSLNVWKFSGHILSKPSLENFEHYFASM